MDTAPGVEFFTIYPGAPLPSPASGDLRGQMPTRAAQLCVPHREASALGFYLFPPVDFALHWDGVRSEIAFLDEEARLGDWRPLDGGTEVFLDSSEAAPESVGSQRRDDLPRVMDPDDGLSFVNAHPTRQNEMEFTLGVVARTAPGWATLVRPLANFPHSPNHQVLDGLVETDWYRSFVPVIVRLTVAGAVVRFFRHLPMAQLHILPLSVRSVETFSRDDGGGLGCWPEDVWQQFCATRGERASEDRQPGTYLRAERRAGANDRDPYRAAGDSVV